MTVQCPRCRTQYKVPNARISDPRPVFKCTRCSLVFSSEAERGPRATARARDEEKNLPLPFASRGKQEDEPELAGPDDATRVHVAVDDEVEDDGDELAGDDDLADDEELEDEGEEEEEVEEDEEERPEPVRRTRRGRRVAETTRDREPAFVSRASRDRASASRREDDARERLRFRRDDGLDEEEDEEEPRRPVLVAAEGKQRRQPINPRRGIRSATAAGRRSPLRPVAIGVGAIAAFYLIVAVSLDRRPEVAIQTLAQVPLLGRLLGGDHLLVWRLQLADVEGGMGQVKGARPAYVVSGRAINTSNEDLRIIEVEGRLLSNGVEQRRQRVYAANQPRKTIQDLSPSEVEMLLKLEPNRRFVIRPGESARFLLVFPDPPPGTTEVTCRVVDARPA